MFLFLVVAQLVKFYILILYLADNDYCRLQPVLLVDQITVIRNEMCI